MHATCFTCDARVAAADLAALGDAFVVHGHGAHACATRRRRCTYATNYAEAVERISDDVQRRDAFAGHFRGPRALFEAHGFVQAAGDERLAVLRLRVG